MASVCRGSDDGPLSASSPEDIRLVGASPDCGEKRSMHSASASSERSSRIWPCTGSDLCDLLQQTLEDQHNCSAPQKTGWHRVVALPRMQQPRMHIQECITKLKNTGMIME